MMTSLALNLIPIAAIKPNSCFRGPRSRGLTDGSFLRKKKMHMIWCQSNAGNVAASNGLSSSLSERSTAGLTAADNDKALIEDGSLILSRNGKAHEGIGLKELVPFGGTANTLTETHQGIGIVRFLKGKGFLITGATGFVAKVLIEKILRTMPDVSKIFLLIKAKSQEAAMERLKNEIINTELFKCLQETHGKSYQAFMLTKLVPVVGNVTEANLGIKADLADEIAREVDIIINSAANTTFDERYDVALDINTKGPCRLMSFTKRCKKLKLFLHVSTGKTQSTLSALFVCDPKRHAKDIHGKRIDPFRSTGMITIPSAYVNGQRQGRILEKPFCLGECIARERMASESSSSTFPRLDVEAEFKMAWDSKEASRENAVAQKMKEMGLERARTYGWQDTYVFTKAMGEMLIDNGRGEIPVVIVRPSIIESTFKEPFPGWIEGNRMMDPLVLYYGKGLLTGFVADPKGVLDVVPADMVVNATLAAMAKHGSAGKPGMNIYHIASSVANPLEIHGLCRLLFEHFKSSPYMDSNGRPIDVPQMKFFRSMEDFSAHVWKDAIQRTRRAAASHGKLSQGSQRLKNMRKKSLEQVKYLASIYEPYTFYGGRFDNTNSQKLMEGMSEEENRSFGFDVGSIDWKEYISNIHIPGLRRHVMKGRGMSPKSTAVANNI